MPTLDIPPSGLSFESVSERTSKSASQDIIGLTLTDDLIEEMIQCVQNGKQISLSLGPRPNISFGNTTQPLADYKDPFAHEIYHATATSSSHTGSVTMTPAGKPCMAFIRQFNPNYNPSAPALNKSAINATKSVTAGADSARENLERSMALAKAKKEENTTRLVGLQAGGKKGKLLSQGRLNDTPRSMPSSPALSGIGSPSLGPTSVPTSQLITEQAKAKRKPIVHLLAVRPMSEKQLRERVDDLSDSDFKQALNKVADKVQNGPEYELFKPYYKELDVWTFNYDTEADRQQAIENAVKKYDQLRIPQNDDEWERLKPLEQRGDGQTLSKVHARIANGPIPRTPKINVSNADSGRDTPGNDSEAPANKTFSKIKKDAINRSSSQPSSTGKHKRVSDKEAQSKRLLSTKPAKPISTPAQKKEVVAKTSAAKPLSSQFVTESDDEDAVSTIVVPPKPAPKKPVAASAPKRAREEENTSDSSQPLSKKVRATNGKPAAPVREHNNKDLSQTSSSTTRTKGTSPQKSSPLASSPPTNASDFNSSGGSCAASDSSTPRHHSNFSSKRVRSPVHKRNASTSSLSTTSSASSTASYNKVDAATLQIASNFRVCYPKYAALHKELSKLREEDRDQRKVERLLEMHERLVGMKTKIKQAALRMAN